MKDTYKGISYVYNGEAWFLSIEGVNLGVSFSFIGDVFAWIDCRIREG